MLMLAPQRFEFFVKLAELHFTIGRPENLILARKYFSFILTINGMALRPLLGLLKTCEMLKSNDKNDINTQIIKVVEKNLKVIYGSTELPENMIELY